MMDGASVKSHCSEVVDTFTSLNVCLGLLISEGAMLTVLTSHVQLCFVLVLLVFSASFKSAPVMVNLSCRQLFRSLSCVL